MNRAKLRSYAPQARRDFIRAVTDRARKVGLTALHSESVQVQGDVAIIGGHVFPKAVAAQRKRLDEQIERRGFNAVMEEAAYTWFNRFMAIRYMEVHEYFEHGYRVLSHPAGGVRPEILEQAEHVDLLGLDRVKVIDLKLDGTKDEELYKSLLLAQGRALHQAMPFLFERIDDATELLLPDGLLASDSLIRKMVVDIPENDWQQIEVIGWLYQFYISEKKDEVIGKVVKSEDIPAATQLFTPNWIVKYMVQNSLGAKWLATYPSSPLRGKMEYYIEPAEQSEAVNAQLAAITPTSLNPETITLIDPACGSGHILVEAYDLFREIYLERGYRPRDIPRLILENNLFGLDIDDRATQMAGFAVLMKARAEDRRILLNVPDLNVRAIQASAGLDAAEISDALLTPRIVELVAVNELFPETRQQPALAVEEQLPLTKADIGDLLVLFEDAKTVGALLTIPKHILKKLPYFRSFLSEENGSLLRRMAADQLEPLITQAELLSGEYDLVVANPPYMGTKGMNAQLKKFTNDLFPNGKNDLYACFIERCCSLSPIGRIALITFRNWMFLSTMENLRTNLLNTTTIESLVYMGRGLFGVDFGTCAYVIRNVVLDNPKGSYRLLFDFGASDSSSEELRERFFSARTFSVSPSEFTAITGMPIAFWLTDELRHTFRTSKTVGDVSSPKAGMQTGDNNKFLRYWWEVDNNKVLTSCRNRSESIKSGKKWFPYNKGGEFRKWYGNNEFVVNWENDGAELLGFRPRSVLRNPNFYFHSCITWSDITTKAFAARYCDYGFIFDVKGSCGFPSEHDLEVTLGLLCSKLILSFMNILNPSITFQVGDISRIPFKVDNLDLEVIRQNVSEAIFISKTDWDTKETSWDFSDMSLLRNVTIDQNLQRWKASANERCFRLKDLEEENNRLFIDAYSLQSEISPEVPYNQITLNHPDSEQDIRQIISYAIGCMMGRYSLTKSGLIYAQSGNENFDLIRYTTFPADDDGILPLTDADWFGNDDTANRLAAFVRVVWPTETLNENLTFVADSLGTKASENALDTIRRYLHTGFYKDHLQTYKKRPIYWLFTSGKERAFQALVYLHRYNAGTLSRMRIEYVTHLQSRISARIAQLEQDIAAATSTADRNKRQKERDKLVRQQTELLHFDEKLRHYADQRITLDLDDGVKVNYGRFGDLLADVKAITGDKDD